VNCDALPIVASEAAIRALHNYDWKPLCGSDDAAPLLKLLSWNPMTEADVRDMSSSSQPPVAVGGSDLKRSRIAVTSDGNVWIAGHDNFIPALKSQDLREVNRAILPLMRSEFEDRPFYNEDGTLTIQGQVAEPWLMVPRSLLISARACRSGVRVLDVIGSSAAAHAVVRGSDGEAYGIGTSANRSLGVRKSSAVPIQLREQLDAAGAKPAATGGRVQTAAVS